MGGFWQRRAARQMVYGLVPLLVVGATVAVLLAVRFGNVAAPVNAATETAPATVVASGLGADHDRVDLSWIDDDSVRHTSQLRFPRTGQLAPGTTVRLHYDPDNLAHAFVAGDATSVRLRNLATGVTLVVLIALAAVAVTVVRIARRRLAETAPATDRRLSVSHSRRGLTTRTWLTGSDGGQTWWLPVYWDPALDRLDPDRPCPVHGAPNPRKLWIAEVDGVPIWPAGRRRFRPPRGQVTTQDGPRAEPRRIPLGQHLRGDIAVAFTAPLLGLLWAYIDDAGAAGFWVSTAVLACVLFWVPSVYGSDPTGPGRS